MIAQRFYLPTLPFSRDLLTGCTPGTNFQFTATLMDGPERHLTLCLASERPDEPVFELRLEWLTGLREARMSIDERTNVLPDVTAANPTLLVMVALRTHTWEVYVNGVHRSDIVQRVDPARVRRMEVSGSAVLNEVIMCPPGATASSSSSTAVAELPPPPYPIASPTAPPQSLTGAAAMNKKQGGDKWEDASHLLRPSAAVAPYPVAPVAVQQQQQQQPFMAPSSSFAAQQAVVPRPSAPPMQAAPAPMPASSMHPAYHGSPGYYPAPSTTAYPQPVATASPYVYGAPMVPVQPVVYPAVATPNVVVVDDHCHRRHGLLSHLFGHHHHHC